MSELGTVHRFHTLYQPDSGHNLCILINNLNPYSNRNTLRMSILLFCNMVLVSNHNQMHLGTEQPMRFETNQCMCCHGTHWKQHNNKLHLKRKYLLLNMIQRLRNNYLHWFAFLCTNRTQVHWVLRLGVVH